NGARYVKPPIDVLRKPEKKDIKPPAEVPIKPQKRFIKPPVYMPAKPEKKYEKYPFEAPRRPGKKHTMPLVESEQPEKPSRLKKLKTIVLDPGHGGYETGLIAKKHKEKNVILDIAKRLRVLLNRGAAQCFLTRKSDHFISLGERIKFTNSKNAEIFLSLHIGRHNNIVIYTPVITKPAAYEKREFMIDKGQEDFMLKTTALRNAMQQAIIEDFGNDMVSVKPLPYSILSKISAAALIIELPSFKDAYYVAELKTKLVNTIYKGISLYEEGTAN
ncbi:MAG: N-acetylmuramoyl-L-alanine amidase, partial [Candidatus Mariimomonas ferrooxydans]